MVSYYVVIKQTFTCTIPSQNDPFFYFPIFLFIIIIFFFLFSFSFFYYSDNGRDSPPEPAPPEVPPRGPSLLATHTIRAVQQSRNGAPPNSGGTYNLASDDVQSESYSGKKV